MNALRSLKSKVGRLVRDLSPTCREVTRLQSRSMDEDLPRHVAVGVKLHLLLCRWCRRYGKQIRFLREALRHEHLDLANSTEAKLPAEARETIKAALRTSDR